MAENGGFCACRSVGDRGHGLEAAGAAAAGGRQASSRLMSQLCPGLRHGRVRVGIIARPARIRRQGESTMTWTVPPHPAGVTDLM